MQAARARRQNPAIGDRGIAGAAAGSSGSGGGLSFSIGSGGDCTRGFPEIDQKLENYRFDADKSNQRILHAIIMRMGREGGGQVAYARFAPCVAAFLFAWMSDGTGPQFGNLLAPSE